MITKTIVQYWDKKEKPQEIKDLMNTWQSKNLDFLYHCFNRDEAEEFIRKYYGNDIGDLFTNAKFPAMQSDIFRVAYCLNKGGVYVDAATKCELSLASLINM